MTPVEVIQRALDAWNRGDLDAWIALFHERAEMRTALEGALRGKFTHRGREEIRAVATEILNDVDVHIKFRSLIRYGSYVLLLGTVGTRGRTEGAALDRPYGVICRVDDGVIGEPAGDPWRPRRCAAILRKGCRGRRSR